MLLTFVCLGCSTSLSASRTASVLQHQQLEASLSTATNLPVTAYARHYGPAQKLAKDISRQMSQGGKVVINNDAITPALVGAGVILSGFPQRNDEIALRYGLYQNGDVALRLTRESLRLESFYQLLRAPVDVSVGVGVAHASIDHGLLGFLSDFGLLDLSQTDVDATLLVGRTWRHGSLYAGPKVVFSHYAATGELTKDQHLSVGIQAGTVEGEFNVHLGQSLLLGGVLGGRLTYGAWSLMLELGAYQSFYTPVVFDTPVNLGGLVLYPSGGVAFTY